MFRVQFYTIDHRHLHAFIDLKCGLRIRIGISGQHGGKQWKLTPGSEPRLTVTGRRAELSRFITCRRCGTMSEMFTLISINPKAQHSIECKKRQRVKCLYVLAVLVPNTSRLHRSRLGSFSVNHKVQFASHPVDRQTAAAAGNTPKLYFFTQIYFVRKKIHRSRKVRSIYSI
jgi:hypothetical protein